MKTVIGVFGERDNAQFAIKCLKNAGYKTKNISIIMKYPMSKKNEVRSADELSFGRTAITGVTTGAVVGGLAGLLIAIGTIAVPGVGSFFVAGPLTAFLGMTGAAAATASGAVTGAVAGGILAAIIRIGIPKKEAQLYEKMVQEGALLIAVPALDEQASEVEYMFHEHDATDIKAVELPLYVTQDETVSSFGEQAKGAYPIVGAKGGMRGDHSKHIQEFHLKYNKNILEQSNVPEIEIK